jgi:hypothetical protein
VVDRNRSPSTGMRHRARAPTVSMLRETVPAGSSA